MATQAEDSTSAQAIAGCMHLNRLHSMSWQVGSLWRSGCILRPVIALVHAILASFKAIADGWHHCNPAACEINPDRVMGPQSAGLLDEW